jgi:hypothetical protein
MICSAIVYLYSWASGVSRASRDSGASGIRGSR